MKFVNSLILLIITTKAVPDTCNYYGNIWQVYPVDDCNSLSGFSEIGKCNKDDTISVTYYDRDGCVGTPAETIKYDCTEPNLCDCSAKGNGANTQCDTRTIKWCPCEVDPKCENPMFDLTLVGSECIPDGDGGGITVDCDYPNLITTTYACNDCSCDAEYEYTENFFDSWGKCSQLKCEVAKQERKKAKNKVTGPPPKDKSDKWKEYIQRGLKRHQAAADNVPLFELGDNTHNTYEYGDYGLSNMQFLLLNVLVSVVTCLLVIACCLTIYFCIIKCRNKKKGSYSFEKVNANVHMDEEENMIPQDK